MTRVCISCPSTIGASNRSGRCRACARAWLNANPAAAEARRAGLKRHYADPANVAAAQARAIEMGRNLPEAERERRRERGRQLGATMLRAAAQAITRETRIENGRKRSDTVLAWCPPAWRAKYRDLKKRGRRAADAKRIILDLIAGRPGPILYAQQRTKLAWCPPSRRDEYCKVAKSLGAAEARRVIEADLTPFERQLARAAAGARLIEVRPLRKIDHAFTLGGVAPEAM